MSLQPGALTSASSSPKKPIILCLHGGGTNSTIFNIQTIRVQRLLYRFFEFVFLDAPFESPPGPGVLPVFEGCEPYFRWARNYQSDQQPIETKSLIENTVRGREDEFVGILGFSQGAKLAAGLLLEQQLRQKVTGDDKGFKFGVFLMGTSPPLVPSYLLDEEKAELVAVPSIHFVGLEDPWVEEGRKLFGNHFDKTFSSLIELQVDHRLPTVEEDTARIVEEIKRLYEETTGKALVDFDAISK